MATSLPSQHPHLAIHLTDRALTPVISSSLPPATFSSQPQAKPKTFSTSPPSSASSSSSSPTASESPTSSQADSLALLTSTALSSYDTAKRLDRGAPLRTMIEYGSPPPAPPPNKEGPGGPVVLHSYMCPMGLVFGAPGARNRRRGSQGSLTTAAAEEDTTEDEGDGKAVASQERVEVENEGEGADGEGPNAPPMFTSTVVAPDASHLRDARRAAGRLERLARVVQTEWVSGAT